MGSLGLEFRKSIIVLFYLLHDSWGIVFENVMGRGDSMVGGWNQQEESSHACELILAVVYKLTWSSQEHKHMASQCASALSYMVAPRFQKEVSS